jgi:anti-sigma factor RsiW
MTPGERLLHRYHDGELDRSQRAAVDELLAHHPELRSLSGRLDRLDEALRLQAAQVKSVDGGASAQTLIDQIMESAPRQAPKPGFTISYTQIIVGLCALLLILFTGCLMDLVRDLIPYGTVAAVSILFGLTLMVAARPLIRMEAGLFSRFMRRRIPVGDGDALVCRVVGFALVVVSLHMMGIWGWP